MEKMGRMTLSRRNKYDQRYEYSLNHASEMGPPVESVATDSTGTG